MLFNTVSYTNLNFKLKINPKISIFKNLEEVWKTLKKKNEWQPCNKIKVALFLRGSI